MALTTDVAARAQQHTPAVYYVRDGICVAGVGVIGWGTAAMLAPPLVAPTVAVTAVATPLVLASGYRRSRRAELVAAVQLAVATEVRGQVAVRMTRWTGSRGLVDRRHRRGAGKEAKASEKASEAAKASDPSAIGGGAELAGGELAEAGRSSTIGWVGRPRRIKVFYTGEADDTDPRFGPDIARRVSNRLLATYVVAAHDRGRCRLVLELRAGGTALNAREKAKQRACKLLVELIPTANVRKVEFNEFGEVAVIEATHESGAKLVASGYRRRVESAVSAMLPGRFRAFWDLETDFVRFERRPVMPESLWIEPVDTSAAGEVVVPFARDEYGEKLVWNPAVSPHWLITGATGTAKTTLEHAILTQVALWGWEILVVDGKRVEFLGFRDWPNVRIVASKPEQQVAVLTQAARLMWHRYNLVENEGYDPANFTPVVLFIDEYAELRETLLAWYAGVKQKGDRAQPPCLTDVPSMARMGRTAKVHIVLSTQRPDVQLLGSGEMRFNFTQRTSVGRLDPEGADMMWNDQSVGVSIPRGVRGRAMATNGVGSPVEAQCFRMPNPAVTAPGTPEAALLDQLRPAEVRYERMLIVPPELEYDDDGLAPPLSYDDYANAEWVLASERPELDPLNNRNAVDPADQKSRSSMANMLGVGKTAGSRREAAALSGFTAAIAALRDGEDAADASRVDVDVLEGYETSARRAWPADIESGDLLVLDGRLVTVDGAPIEDFDDEDCMVIDWRDDFDDVGQMITPADELLEVHKPLRQGDTAGTVEAEEDSAAAADRRRAGEDAESADEGELAGVLVKFPSRGAARAGKE